MSMQGASVEMRGPLSGVDSLLPPCGSQVIRLGAKHPICWSTSLCLGCWLLIEFLRQGKKARDKDSEYLSFNV